jgi:glutaredoxin
LECQCPIAATCQGAKALLRAPVFRGIAIAGCLYHFVEFLGRVGEFHPLIQRQDLIAGAREIGLAMTRFLADLDNPKWDDVMKADIDEGSRLGVTGTPTLFINGKEYVGARSAQELEQIVYSEVANAGMRPVSFGQRPVPQRALQPHRLNSNGSQTFAAP